MSSKRFGLDVPEFLRLGLIAPRISGAVIGTYRLQTGRNAALHRSYYSAREFNFTPFEPVRLQLVELGRACVAHDHRIQAVLGLLWKGIAQYAKFHGARYLTGSSSLTSQDEAGAVATFHTLATQSLVESRWQTQPCPGWECAATKKHAIALPIPRLLHAYLAIGAKICGAPAIDREFSTIDFLTWLDLEALPSRVWLKFLA